MYCITFFVMKPVNQQVCCMSVIADMCIKIMIHFIRRLVRCKMRIQEKLLATNGVQFQYHSSIGHQTSTLMVVQPKQVLFKAILLPFCVAELEKQTKNFARKLQYIRWNFMFHAFMLKFRHILLLLFKFYSSVILQLASVAGQNFLSVIIALFDALHADYYTHWYET